MQTRVGFLGLGVMGLPIALNLVKAGYPLTVYNRTAEKAQPAVAAGAKQVDSPKALAAASDVVFTMLVDSPDVREVLTRPDGLLAGAHEGLAIVDMTTTSPEAAREFAALCAEKGLEFADAPVSGGDKGAKEGTLSIMFGGSEALFERLKPLLDVLGKTVTYCGPAGNGQSVKLVNQVVCGLNLLAMAEGLAMAERLGLDLELVLKVITQGAAGSWMLSNLAPKAAKGDFSPGFKVKLQQKDLRIALSSAAALSQPLPGTALANQLFAAVEAAGGAELGTQALVLALRKLGSST